MPIQLPRQAIVALLLLASAPAFAASYYVVTPVLGKKIADSAITVALSAVSVPQAQVGVPFEGLDLRSALSVTGDPGFTGYGVKWAIVSGQLPDGLTLNADGTVTGTPLTAGASSFRAQATYKAKSGQQEYHLATYNLNVSLAAGTPPPAIVGQPYAYNLSALVAVQGPPAVSMGDVSWRVVAGSLPTGLQISSAGHITGTPVAAGASSATVRAEYKGTSADQTYLVAARVDYSAQMAGYTTRAVAIARNAAWADGLQWYWRSADAQFSAPAGTFEFRRMVTVPGNAPVTAYIFGSVDNSVARLSVNGTTAFSNYSMPFTQYSSSPTFTLQPGINVVAVQVANAGTDANPAGLAMQVRQDDGAVLGDENGWYIQP